MLMRQLGRDIEIHTSAKLNLFLELLWRRDDGYHEIETLMTSISIFDTVYFSAWEGTEIRVQCDWCCGAAARDRANDQLDADRGELPVAADNLVHVALERLRERAAVTCGGSIRVIKRIPVAAGLGGASSDAAAALVAANQGWRIHWSTEQLAQLAGEIGSDIPFFLTGGMAICRGRGERIQPVLNPPRLHLVVVRPPVGLSTPLVYRHCQVPDQPRSIDPLIHAVRAGRPQGMGPLLMNRLQEPAERICSWIGRLRAAFDRLDLLGHRMSGSGSSYYGLCRGPRHARRVAHILRASRIGWTMPVTSLGPRLANARLS